MSPAPAGSVAAIIAGGRGTRLGGISKGALVIGGRTVLDRQLEVLRPRFRRILVVTSVDGPWRQAGLDVIPDRREGLGPLAGIETALMALDPDEAGSVCIASDMPFLSGPLLERLRDESPADASILAQSQGSPEPLLSRYSRGALPVMTAALDRGERRLMEVLRRLGPQARTLPETVMRTLDPDLLSLVNLNTPEDVARAESLAAVPS